MNKVNIRFKEVLERLGIKEINPGVSTGVEWIETNGNVSGSESPVDGSLIASVKTATKEDYELVMEKAQEAFKVWREVPAPQRGEVVRQIGLALRKAKEDLGMLVTSGNGKNLPGGSWGGSGND